MEPHHFELAGNTVKVDVPDDLRKLAESMHRVAGQVIAEGKAVPALLAKLPGPEFVNVTAFMLPGCEAALGQLIRDAIRLDEVTGLILVGEAWMKSLAEGEPIPSDLRDPQHHPDRVEVLMITVYTKVGQIASASKINRPANTLEPFALKNGFMQGQFTAWTN